MQTKRRYCLFKAHGTWKVVLLSQNFSLFSYFIETRGNLILGRGREYGALYYCCCLYCTTAVGGENKIPTRLRKTSLWQQTPQYQRNWGKKTSITHTHLLWVLPCTRCAKISALQQVWHFRHFNVNWLVYNNLFPSLARGASHMFHTVPRCCVYTSCHLGKTETRFMHRICKM